MSMEISGVQSNTVINHYETKISVKSNNDKVQTDNDTNNKENTVAADESVTYEKGDPVSSGTYSINKMSQADRDKIVEQMKADAAQRQEQLFNLVRQTLTGQISAYGKAEDDDIWKILSGGNFTVDAATKAQAQLDIGEDGYWGVKQTSQRLFDFASALAGDDVEQMHKMQEAMEKGFKLATAAWGRELPSICQNTLDAANHLFEEYYKSKESEETQVKEGGSDKVQ